MFCDLKPVKMNRYGAKLIHNLSNLLCCPIISINSSLVKYKFFGIFLDDASYVSIPFVDRMEQSSVNEII